MAPRQCLANFIFQLFLPPHSCHPNSWYFVSSHLLGILSTSLLLPHLVKSQTLLQIPALVSFQHGSISQLPRSNITTPGPLLSSPPVHTTLVNLKCVSRCMSLLQLRMWSPHSEATLYVFLSSCCPPQGKASTGSQCKAQATWSYGQMAGIRMSYRNEPSAW